MYLLAIHWDNFFILLGVLGIVSLLFIYRDKVLRVFQTDNFFWPRVDAVFHKKDKRLTEKDILSYSEILGKLQSENKELIKYHTVVFRIGLLGLLLWFFLFAYLVVAKGMIALSKPEHYPAFLWSMILIAYNEFDLQKKKKELYWRAHNQMQLLKKQGPQKDDKLERSHIENSDYVDSRTLSDLIWNELTEETKKP